MPKLMANKFFIITDCIAECQITNTHKYILHISEKYSSKREIGLRLVNIGAERQEIKA